MRGFKKRPSQLVGLIVLIMMTSVAYVGLNNSAVQLGGQVEEYMVESNLEHMYFDVNTTVETMPDDMRLYLEGVTGLAGEDLKTDIANNRPKYYEGYFLDYIEEYMVETSNITVSLNSLKNYCGDKDIEADRCNLEYSFLRYDSDKEVNKPLVIDGRMPENGNEIAIFPEYADAHGIKLGDTLTIDGNDFKVVGTAYQANYILPTFSVEGMLMSPDQKTAVFATSEGYNKITGVSIYSYSVVFNEVKGVYEYDEVVKYVKEFRGTYTGIESNSGIETNYISSAVPYYMNPSISAVFNEMNNMEKTGSVLSSVILVLALVIVGFMVKKRIENDGKQLGVLKSLGYTSREIAVGYMALPLMSGLIGLTIGFIIGSFISIPLINLLRESYLVPSEGYVFDFGLFFGGFILPGLIMMTVAFVVIAVLLRTTAVDLLKPGNKMDTVKERPTARNDEGIYTVKGVLTLPFRYIAFAFSRAYNWFKFKSLRFLQKRHAKKINKLREKESRIDKKDKIKLEKHAKKKDKTENSGFISRFKYSLVLRSPGKLISIFFTIFVSSMLLVITMVGTTLVDDMMEIMEDSMPFDKFYVYYAPVNADDNYDVLYDDEDGIALMYSDISGAAPILTNINRNGVDITPENKLLPEIAETRIDEECVADGGSEEDCTILYDEYGQVINTDVTLTLTGKRQSDNEIAPLYNKKGDEISAKLKDGMIITDFMKAWYGLEVGDTVTIELTYYDFSYDMGTGQVITVPHTVYEDVKIVDVTNEFFNPSGYVDFGWLNEVVGNNGSENYVYNYKYTNDTTVNELETPFVAFSMNVSNMMEDLEEQMEMMDIFIGIVVVIAGILSLVIIVVMTNFTIEDNFKNISLLKVMGYQDKEISKMVLRIYSPVIMIAYFISIPVTIVVLETLMAVLGELMGVSIPVRMRLTSALIGFATMMVSYMIAIQISKRRVSKIPLQEALKED